MWNYACLLWALLFASGVKEVIMTAGDTVTQCDFSTNSGGQEKSVTVEDNVTLCGFSELKGDYAIRWKFNNSVIFRVEEALKINDMHPGEIFGNKLELDKQTGSLSIKEVESKHAGTYHLEIRGNDYVKTKQFSVIVNEVESKSMIKGASFSLSFDNIQQGVQWKVGNEFISTGCLNGNICVNDETGELHFEKIKIEQGGIYEVWINTSSLILHRKFIIKVEPPSSGAGSGLCGAGVSLVVWIVAVFLLQEV